MISWAGLCTGGSAAELQLLLGLCCTLAAGWLVQLLCEVALVSMVSPEAPGAL